MPLIVEHLRLALRDPFTIARQPGPTHEAVVTTVIVEKVGPDAQSGLGEACPVAYYGETPGTVDAVLPVLDAAVSTLGEPWQDLIAARAWLQRAWSAMQGVIAHNTGAKCGLDIALHDLVAKRLGVPLYELLGTQPECPPTDLSLGLGRPEEVAQRAARARRFPALKVKLGGGSDIETLEAVREVYSGPIRVDANGAWEPERARALIPELVRLGVELIEQPFGAYEHAQLRWLQEASELPIVADESALDERDLDRLVGVVRGVNVKLTKCGGLVPALRMIRRARELGFLVMLGCESETSVGIAAAAALGSLVDWVDLDSNLLLVEEPFQGLALSEDCRWLLPAVPGLGVERVKRQPEDGGEGFGARTG
jgi:L-alanine-DL-glutamate epimerase-like enolase superfamily enzyme